MFPSLLTPRAAGILLSGAVLGIHCQVAMAAPFRDTFGHWAQAYIETLSAQGVLNGFPDGTFRPNEPVTRAQFATIVNTAFRLRNTSGTFIGFRDVPPTHWAASAISTAAANNLVAGFPDGTFRPEQPVTRTEALVVLTNAIGNTGAIPAAQPSDLFSRYRDAAAIPNWALAQLAAANRAGLIVNYPDPMLLEPNRPATRAEVAAFTHQAMLSRGSLVAQNPGGLPSGSQPGFDLRLSTLAAGTLMQTTTPFNERLFIAPNETRPMSLIVRNPIRNAQGDILVPFGSRVDGRFEPAPGGTRFVAESIIVNNQLFPLAAQSDIIHDVKDPRYTTTGKIIQDAAIGAAAGAILGLVTGDNAIATEEVLGAGVAGAVIGNVTAPQVVVLDPNQVIELRLTQDLALAPASR
ncbi:S-layer homology domain-containing protein [Synechococcus sp. W55.1]|uniref:S-layer homology domain-containing protein n=2 Tax=unclassified Synechococcus TaxID=2626047 RepID=UPI0039C32F0C